MLCLFVFPKFQGIFDTLNVLGVRIWWNLNWGHRGTIGYNWRNILRHCPKYYWLMLIVDVMIHLAVWLVVLLLLVQFKWLLHVIVLSLRNTSIKVYGLEASMLNELIMIVTLCIGNNLHVLDSSLVEEPEFWL